MGYSNQYPIVAAERTSDHVWTLIFVCWMYQLVPATKVCTESEPRSE